MRKKKTCKKIKKKGGDSETSMKTGFKNASIDIVQGLGTGVGNTLSSVGNVSQGVGTGVGKAAEGVGNIVYSSSKGIGTGVGKATEGVGKGTGKIAEGVGTGTGKLAENTLLTTAELVNVVKTKLERYNERKNKKYTKIDELKDETINNLKIKINQYNEKITEDMNINHERIINTCKYILNYMIIKIIDSDNTKYLRYANEIVLCLDYLLKSCLNNNLNCDKIFELNERLNNPSLWTRIRNNKYNIKQICNNIEEVVLSEIPKTPEVETVDISDEKQGGCLPCAAAAGPAGIAVAAVGTAGYYGYKKMKGGTGKFKKNEKLLYVENDGRTHQVKFRRYITPKKASIKFLSRKALRPRSTVNVNKLRTIKKTIMNTRKRQKNRRADTVRRKRNITLKKNKTDELSRLFSGLFK
tara:strand:+ start:1281 stop:2516 length:1236 start_codon:yes stop_codon:yes gene_type:complete